MRSGPILLLLMCPWGYIYGGFRLPSQVGVVLPVVIISVTILGIIWWPILS